MSEKFDPYHRWLGIQPKDRPPTHYRLLGIDEFENDLEVVRDAAVQRMTHVRTYQLGPHSEISQKILNELGAAKACLLNPEKKAEYDERLRRGLQNQRVAPAPQTPATPVGPPTQAQTPAEGPLPSGSTEMFQQLPPGRRQGATKRAAAASPWLRQAPLLGGVLLAAVLVPILAVVFWSGGPTEVAQRQEPAKTPEEKKLRPPKPSSYLILECSRADLDGAAVTVDGSLVTLSRQREPGEVGIELKPGQHTLEINRTGYEPIRRDVSISEGTDFTFQPVWTQLASTPKTEPNPEPKPEQPKPESVAEPPEKFAERVKDAFAKAKTPRDFRAVAGDALKLIEQANTAGKADVAKSTATLALSAARKADDDRLAKTATRCLLEPGAVYFLAVETPDGGENAKVYLDDLEEFDVSVGYGTLGKHGGGPYPNDRCALFGKVPVHSLCPHPPCDGTSSVSYRLAAQFKRFHSTVAIADECPTGTPVTFRVRSGDRVLWESYPIKERQKPQECNISVEGVMVLTLEVSCPGPNGSRATVWFDPYLTRDATYSSGQRATVPDAAAQERALKLVRDLFKDKALAATTSEKQKALAEELLQKAQSTKDDAATQYVLFEEAGRFAIRAKDADLASQVIEEMGATFNVDAFDLKVKSLMVIGKSLGPHEQSAAIAGSLLVLMEEAGTKDEFDTAKELGAMATDLARKSKDSALLKETVARQKAITKSMLEVKQAQAEVASAVDVLAKNPTDDAANLAVGRYYCFIKNQWNKGIPMLALGNDPALKDLALKELKGPMGDTERANVGDAWWDLGEKQGELARNRLKGHAAYWYQQALSGLTGLAKETVEKRLGEMEAVEATSQGEKASAAPAAVHAAPRGRLRPGLVGEYYKGHNFNHPIGPRIDARPALDWAEANTVIPNDHFSIRWTGFVVAPKAGRYVITITSDDGHRFWLDGKLIANPWKIGRNQTTTPVSLGDKPHLVRFEYYQDHGPKYFLVKWRPEGSSADEDLPAEVLFHARGPLDGKTRAK